jgi:PelA/Pel-15E family pectate lyase
MAIVVAAAGLRVSADPREDALSTLKRAATYYHDNVAVRGGYVYFYSTDLRQRWGEGKAGDDTVFVQPPGTPTVGMAFLSAYAATGDKFHLDAARDAAGALAYGQLQSGGWTQKIDFKADKESGKYRNGKGGNRNTSSLDDDQTQSALKMLVLTDQALHFQDAAIHEAAIYGLDALLKAQFAGGAFPQVWTGPVDSQPIVPAKYPTYDWRTEGRLKNYWDYYTLNDGLAGTVAETLITAHQVYGDDKFKAALARLGDFLLAAQMPMPQPGWCQQYNYEMAPIWARKFEPPAVSGWESQDAMETLIRIARYTENKKYLVPVPKCMAWLRKSMLPDGRVARYYELKSNRPLYMNDKYELTYDDSQAPDHYGWKQPQRLNEIDALYRAAQSGKPEATPKTAQQLAGEAATIVKALDADGRWVTKYAGERLVGQPKFSPGFAYLSSDVFSRNVTTLSEYLTATKK